MSRTLRALGACLALAAVSAAAARLWSNSRAPAQADEPAPAEQPAAGQSPEAPAPARPKFEQERLRGRVVWLGEGLKRRYDIQIDADAAETQVVLETADGELHPLVKDARGRAFHIDERWRNMDVELLVRRHAGSPFLQVIRVYAIEPDGIFELDYWCDICAIAMFELKACECCQGTSRIRKRLVSDEAAP